MTDCRSLRINHDPFDRPLRSFPCSEATVPLQDLNGQSPRARVHDGDQASPDCRRKRTDPGRAIRAQDRERERQGHPGEEPQHGLDLRLAEQRQATPEGGIVQVDTGERIAE